MCVMQREDVSMFGANGVNKITKKIETHLVYHILFLFISVILTNVVCMCVHAYVHERI